MIANPFEEFPRHWDVELAAIRKRIGVNGHVEMSSRGPAKPSDLERLSRLFPRSLPRSLEACLSMTDGFDLVITEEGEVIGTYGSEELQIFSAQAIVDETARFREFFTEEYIPEESDHLSPANLEQLVIIGRLYSGDAYIGLHIEAQAADHPVVKAYQADDTWLKDVSSMIIAPDLCEFICRAMVHRATSDTVAFWEHDLGLPDAAPPAWTASSARHRYDHAHRDQPTRHIN